MEETYSPGLGIDIGTSFLVLARQKEDGTPIFKSERDAFFAIEPKTQKQMKLTEDMLIKRNAFTLKKENKLYVVGQEAINLANERNLEVCRPLKKGVLTASDLDSIGMLAVVIEALLGKAFIQNELCIYCFPAEPVDAEYSIIYHKNRLNEILLNLGYNPKGILEGEALMYSELGDDDYTGISISCGAGMFNLNLSYMLDTISSFSISRGGDYLDYKVAQNFGLPESTVQAEKEEGLNLNMKYDPSTLSGRIKNNLVDEYGELIRYTAAVISAKCNSIPKLPNFNKPVPIVVAGGTSLPEGFLGKFSAAIKQFKFPFEVGKIVAPNNSLTAIANGCLVYSQMEGEEG